MRLVLDKTVDLGVSQMSEVIQANRDALVGPFPGEFDLATTFSLWHRADVSAAVRDFVALIESPAGQARLAAEGFRVRSGTIAAKKQPSAPGSVPHAPLRKRP
jgi:hypothetical protein